MHYANNKLLRNTLNFSVVQPGDRCTAGPVVSSLSTFWRCTVGSGHMVVGDNNQTSRNKSRMICTDRDSDDKEKWTQQRVFLRRHLCNVHATRNPLGGWNNANRGKSVKWHEDTRLHVNTLYKRGEVRCVRWAMADGRLSREKVKVIPCFAVVLAACALNQSWRGSKTNCAASSLLCVSSAGHVCEACPLIVSINTAAEDVQHRWALPPWPRTTTPPSPTPGLIRWVNAVQI